MRPLFNSIVLVLALGLSSTVLAQNYHVTYGKSTHIVTDGPILSVIQGNKSWMIQLSPQDDGVFVWSKKNSIPTNLVLYTAHTRYNVDLTPSTMRHDRSVTPAGIARAAEPPRIQALTDTQQLETLARRAIKDKKRARSETPAVASDIPETSQSSTPINFHSTTPIAAPTPPAADTTPEPAIERAAVPDPDPTQAPVSMTLRDFIHKALGEDYTIVELPGDSSVLNMTIDSPSRYSSLKSLYPAIKHRVERIFIDPVTKQVRVRSVRQQSSFYPASHVIQLSHATSAAIQYRITT